MKALVRKLFFSLSTRERMLLSLTIWALLILWASFLLDIVGTETREYKNQTAILKTYDEIIETEFDALELLEAAKAGLDRNKTFSASQLNGMIDSIARENGLVSNIRTPFKEETDLFSFNRVRIRVTKASLVDLIQFDQQLKTHSPYIAVSDFRLTSNKRDQRLLDADFEMISFELKEDALND